MRANPNTKTTACLVDEFSSARGRASDPRTLYHAGSDRGGHFDRDEAVGREQIILAALVDDAQVTVALGVLVGKDGVDLVALERRLVP